MKTFKVQLPVTIATLVSLVVLGAALLILHRSIKGQDESWEWVVHTREVLEQVQTTLTHVSEAEAAQRGFLLTGNELFAASYRQARDAIPAEIRTLRELTRDNPRQQQSLAPLDARIAERMAMLEAVMEQKRRGAEPTAAALESGRLLKQDILAQANHIRAEEHRLLEERQRRTAAARQDLFTAVGIVATLSVCLIILLWVISSRDAARLHSERARLDATLRSIGDGVIATDAAGTVRLMNPVSEALTGTAERAAVGRPLDQVLRVRDQGSGATLAAATLRANHGAHALLLMGGGRDYAIELTAAPIDAQRAGSDGTVLVFKDVTERNARERALAESEANYRYTIDLNPQIPWKASPQGDIGSFSGRWLALTGQAPDGGGGWSQVVIEEDRPAFARAWAHSLATGEPYDVEHRIRTASGEVRWMRSRANPRRDGDGAIVAWYGLTEDIHARKESELALARRETELHIRLAQIETIYRAVPVGLGYVDAQLRLAELNDALVDAAGRPKAACIGAAPADILPAPLGGQVGRYLEQVLAARHQLAGIEFRSESGEGNGGNPGAGRDWLGSFYPVIDEGQVNGIVLALLEVTQIKTAQRALIAANESLEQRIEERTARIAEANAELRAFAHTVAHDLRAPLRNVEGFATALLEDEAPRMSEDGKLFARRIVAAVTRMDQLITDLLAYSRLSRAELQLDAVDTNTVLKAVLRDLEAEIAGSGARIAIAPALPAVRASQAVLVQVLANLVSNAIKFVAPGVVPEVDIRGSTDGITAKLSIGDNGIGIAPEHREHVFGVFERLHGHEKYPGTGIGLAIVRKGLERMGGTVRILGRPQGGTVFELTLPAATTA